MRKANLIKTVFVCGAMFVPAMSQASVATFAYDTVSYSTDPSLGSGVITVPIVGNAITVPAGDYFAFNLSVTVTANPNPAAALPYSTGSHVQPANLGLNSFGESIADSNNAVAAPVDTGGGVTTAAIDGNFNGEQDSGVIDDAAGDIGQTSVADQIAGGVLASTTSSSSSGTTGSIPPLTIGANGPEDVYTGLEYSTSLTGGTVTLTSSIPTSTIAFVEYSSGGTSSTQKVTYGTRNFDANYSDGTPSVDSIVGPGNLTVVVTAVPEPASLGLLGVGAFGLLTRRRNRAL